MKYLKPVFRVVGLAVFIILSLLEMLFELLHAAVGACLKVVTGLIDYVAALIEIEQKKPPT